MLSRENRNKVQIGPGKEATSSASSLLKQGLSLLCLFVDHQYTGAESGRLETWRNGLVFNALSVEGFEVAVPWRENWCAGWFEANKNSFRFKGNLANTRRAAALQPC